MIEFLRRLVFAFVLLFIAFAVSRSGSFGLGRATWLSLNLPAIWTVLAVAASTAALASIVRKPTLAVLLVLGSAVWLLLPRLATPPSISLALSSAGPNLNLLIGTVPPAPVIVAVAFLCITALLLERGHPHVAAIVTASMIFNPLIALTASIALFILVPAARIILILALIVAAFAGATILGPPGISDQLKAAFPTNPDAIAGAPSGTAHLLIALHVQPESAVSIGWALFAIALLLGIIVARRFAPASERPAAIVLLPVATAMLGYPLFSEQFALVALPAALALAPISWPAKIAVALLVPHWDESLRSAIVPIAAAGAGTAFVAFARDEVRGRVGWLVFAPLVTLALLAVLPRLGLQMAVATGLTWLGFILLFFLRPAQPKEFRFSR